MPIPATFLILVMQRDAAGASMASRVSSRGADARVVFGAGVEWRAGLAHGRGGQGAGALGRQADGRVGLPADAAAGR
jgi:hypothetical protein